MQQKPPPPLLPPTSAKASGHFAMRIRWHNQRRSTFRLAQPQGSRLHHCCSPNSESTGHRDGEKKKLPDDLPEPCENPHSQGSSQQRSEVKQTQLHLLTSPLTPLRVRSLGRWAVYHAGSKAKVCFHPSAASLTLWSAKCYNKVKSQESEKMSCSQRELRHQTRRNVVRNSKRWRCSHRMAQRKWTCCF